MRNKRLRLVSDHTLHSGKYLYSPYMAVTPPGDQGKGFSVVAREMEREPKNETDSRFSFFAPETARKRLLSRLGE